MEEPPPGGACRRVEERPVMTLPAFWLLPQANLLLDVAASAAGSPLWSKMLKLLPPPGGACRRVDERPVMTLPQFWLEPLAKALEDWAIVRRMSRRIDCCS